MEYILSTVVCNFLFLVMDLVIMFFVFNSKNKSRKQILFSRFAICVTILQALATYAQTFSREIYMPPRPLTTIIYICLISLLTGVAFFWYIFLCEGLTEPENISYMHKSLATVPLALMIALCIISPFTEWIFYVTEDGIYHRGTLFFLQIVFPYVYVIFAIILVISMRKKGKKDIVRSIFPHFLCFLIPSIIGSAIQAFVVKGGYSVIGISICLICMYLKLYVDEINRNERLEEQKTQIKKITALNKILEDNRNELQRRLAVIQATGQRYFCAYYMDIDNDHFYEIFSFKSMTEVLGREGKASTTLTSGWKNMVLEDDQPIMRDFLDISRWKEYLRERDIYSVEYRGITSGWSRATLFAAERNAKGDVTHVVYTLEMIHEQKETEEKLKYRLSVAQVINSIFYCAFLINLDSNTVVSLGSDAGREGAFTLEPDAQEGFWKSTDIYVDPEYRQSMKEFLDFSTMDERLRDGSVSTNKFYGSKVGWSNAYLIPGEKDENGKLKQVFYVIRDFNKEQSIADAYTKQLEEARQNAESANKAKSDFLFNMSHDIRTPMNAIIGYTELMDRHKGDRERFEDYLSKIKDSSRFLLSLINDVLEMARIESGKALLDDEPIDMRDVEKEIVSVYYDLMSEKNITYNKINNVSKPYLYGDKVKLVEIFMNLLSNAYKYTPEGGTVTVTINELPYKTEGWTMIETVVSDNGIGMSKEFIPHLYDDFARENNTTAIKIQGTGLGMPIVKKYAQLMGGSIDVESELGKGTTFKVYIPHRIADSPKNEFESDVIAADRLEGKRILLAEDNDFNAEIASEILQDVGIEVDRAEDGARCVKMLIQAEAGYYDLVLMDIQMPNKNGYEATRDIREMEDSQKSNIPIIAMTANAFEEDRKKAFDAGMNGHLAKPFDITKLMKMMTELL